jgi:thiol-disulfide isomerase/thioredoxin
VRVIAAIVWFCTVGAAVADDRVPSSVLHLINGDFISGELQASQDPKVLRWRSPLFAAPLEFPLTTVNAVQYAVAGPQPQPPGEYCFELGDEDVLYGNLLGLTEDEVELHSARIGRVHLRREQIRRFSRHTVADSIYLGPNGLAGWKESWAGYQRPGLTAVATSVDPRPAQEAGPGWRDEGGQLFTDQWGASIFGDLGIPDKAVIEFEISWRLKPDFVFALGVDDRDAALKNAFHFEVWDGEVVVVGESARDADVASVQLVGAGSGHVRVQVYLDQTQRRLILLSRSGKPLATLNIGGKKPPVHGGVRLTNRNGDVRLEHLRITRWNGLPPRAIREDQSRLHKTDGSVVYGRLTAYDPNSKQFTIRDGTTQTLVKHDEIAEVFLSPSLFADKTSSGLNSGISDRALRVTYRDGSRFSGALVRIEDGHLTLACPGVKEPLRLPLADVRSLIALRMESPSVAEAQSLNALGHRVLPAAGRAGRLEMDGVRMGGRLVDPSSRRDAGCLVWHPDMGQSASPLVRGASGRIVYRDAVPSSPSPPQMQRPQPAADGIAQVIANFLKPGTASQPQVPPGTRKSLHLRSGDTIPCEVNGIDEKGLTFKTSLSDATFVAHEKIKSVELIPTQSAPELDEVKRDRLLTLPRMQKGSPPTHLICSRNGDFLRGRILEMDEKRLKVEIRLETRDVPRDRVAQIIWLHADELTDRKPGATAVEPIRADRVQTMNANGNRLTFVVEKADHQKIAGKSDVLGACRADLNDVDQLLFGTFIEESASKLAYHLWKLHHATEPKFAQGGPEASTDSRSAGTESPLVGQPAIPFDLDMLDGSPFKLANHKGRVVVLDFWATWCGPCLQSMPLIDGVVREFAAGSVELFAVNMEEQPEQIKSTLERHKLKVPVVLDRDGVVAAKYAVTAIPQTVVIDREGKIARLFVGGGKKTAESLRKALQELSVEKTPATGSP